jgi:hypothetical protein
MLDDLSWTASLFLLTCSIALAVANARILLRWLVLRRKSSIMPFLGGILGVGGVLLLPVHGTNKWFWLPLIFDWGALPTLALAAFYRIRTTRTLS